MDIWHVVLLAIVEGITEFLPISSTGHMMVASHLAHIPDTPFLKTFEIAIQCGAILAVLVLYWRTFLLDWEKISKVFIAFIPTAVIGFLLYKVIKKYLIGHLDVFIWALFLGGVLMIFFERYYQKQGQVKKIETISDIPLSKALWVGVFQSLAVIPGVSRSAATIIGGLFMGIRRDVIVEFSFLLAVPTMAAATLLDILKTEAVMGKDEWVLLLIGMFLAFLVALVAIKGLLSYIRRFDFVPFGFYRVIAALVFALLIYKVF